MTSETVFPPRLVPDSEDLVHALYGALDVLEHVQSYEQDVDLDDPNAVPWRLPVPLADSVALEALYRVREVCEAGLDAPTEDRPHLRGRPALPRLLGADGRHEHLPLRPLALDPADLATVRTAHRVAVRALDPAERAAESNPWQAQALTDLADILGEYRPATGRGIARDLDDPGDALRPLETVLATLDPPVDDDTDVILTALDRARDGRDVVLTPTEDAAYQRLARRINTALGGSDLTLFLY